MLLWNLKYKAYGDYQNDELKRSFFLVICKGMNICFDNQEILKIKYFENQYFSYVLVCVKNNEKSKF